MSSGAMSGSGDVIITESVAASSTQNESKRSAREKERQERLQGKLTDLNFKEISCIRNDKADFVKQGLLVCIRGSKSQFDARTERMKAIMPPLTGDCCQTFSTLSAILLSSLGFAVMMRECSSVSTVNYLLYVSAWMHQLSVTSWPQKGVRPTIGDLNACLHLRDFFPSRINAEEFDIVFYNQAEKALGLLREMCPSLKRGRGADGKHPVCGYVIVSGDYTVSVFSVDHDIRGSSSTRYSQAWSFYICDSHGTQPWSLGKASLTGISFGVLPARPLFAERKSDSIGELLSVDDGLHYFSTILFTLLEEHRGSVPRTAHIPYMTWTPLRRRKSLAFTAQELKGIIDRHWIPKVLSDEKMRTEAAKFNFKPLECFWSAHTSSSASSPPQHSKKSLDEPVASEERLQR